MPRGVSREKDETHSLAPTKSLPSSSSSHPKSRRAKFEEKSQSSSSLPTGSSLRTETARDHAKETVNTYDFEGSKNPTKLKVSQQRAPKARHEAQHGTSSAFSDAIKDKSKYKHPYVEDSSSRVNASKSTASGSSRRHVDGVDEKPISAEGAQHEGESQWNNQPSTPPSRVLSEVGGSESRISDNPHPPSSGSSSAKSVSFNPSVGVRQPSRRATSETSSDSDVENTAIKPDDDSQPSRAGIYGDSPTRDSYGQPMSTSEYSVPSRDQNGSDFGWASRSSPTQWDFRRESFNASDLRQNETRAGPSQEPAFEWTRGVFSGMSSNSGNDNWKSFNQEPTDGGSSPRKSSSKSQPSHDETYGSFGQNSSHEAPSRSSLTQEPAQAFGVSYADDSSWSTAAGSTSTIRPNNVNLFPSQTASNQ